MDRPEQIARTVAALAEVPRAELDAFIGRGTPLTLSAGAYFVRPQQTDHPIGFIHRGLVRYHVVTAEGDDITKDFSPSGNFTLSYGSALLGEPAQVAVSAVETCELTVWPYALMRATLERSAAWERLGRRVAEMLFVRKEKRELSFLLRSATERYLDAKRTFGPAVVRIPQYQLASYLGIAPESLSRLRRKAAARR